VFSRLFTIFACSRDREHRIMANKEYKNIVVKALEVLQQQARIQGKWKPIAQTPDKGIDGQIEFTIQDKTVKVYVEIKNNIRTVHLPKLYQLATKNTPLMVVAGQIYPKIKEELRKHNIAYLEANGNIWLKYKYGLFWIDANKALPEEKEKVNRAFTKTGLKVIFDILCDEQILNQPYRTIAKQAGIALGNVNYIMNGLKEKGFLLKLNKNDFKLTRKEELLDTWIAKYEEKLKPELEIGTFRFLKPDDFLQWKRLPLKTGKTWWGGEPGGDLYTNYLKPAVLTLYTTETRNDLIKNYRLIPDPKGNVKVYHKFWTFDKVNDKAAPPLLVYADLINTGDARCIETAKKMYHEFFEGKL
jgi:hypothetical protein